MVVVEPVVHIMSLERRVQTVWEAEEAEVVLHQIILAWPVATVVAVPSS
jgi:hypothetical protein